MIKSISRKTHIDYKWNDSFEFIELFPDLSRKSVTLSRRNLLKKISELDEITDLHILLLKHITEFVSITHYPGPSELSITLSYDPYDTIRIDICKSEFCEHIQKLLQDD